MNRQPPRPHGAPSKATASTLCQKCLKKGHYSYECTVSAQQRPYTSRPSRTQQLLNPQLLPKLSSDVPNDLLRKKGVADEQLARVALERGRKRVRIDDQNSGDDASKQARSPSPSNSASVSTISTNLSRSPSPPSTRPPAMSNNNGHSGARPGRAASPVRHANRQRRPARSVSESSYSSGRSPSPRSLVRDSRRTTTSSEAPQARRARDRSSSQNPQITESRKRTRSYVGQQTERREPINRSRPRLRSMSPYSKRLALTQAMNL